MQQAGLQTKQLLAAAGLTQAELDDPDQLFSAEVLAAVWQEAMAASNNPSLGLLVGAKMDVGLLGIVGQLLRNAPTLKGAMEQLLAYYRLAADVFLFEITPVPEGVKLVFCFPPQANWNQWSFWQDRLFPSLICWSFGKRPAAFPGRCLSTAALR